MLKKLALLNPPSTADPGRSMRAGVGRLLAQGKVAGISPGRSAHKDCDL